MDDQDLKQIIIDKQKKAYVKGYTDCLNGITRLVNDFFPDQGSVDKSDIIFLIELLRQNTVGKSGETTH